MNRILILLMLLLSVVSSSSLNNNYISLTSYTNKDKAILDKDVIDDRLSRNLIISKLKNKYDFKITVNEKNAQFNVSLTDFTNSSIIPIVYDFLKDDFIDISMKYNRPKEVKASDKLIETLVIGFILFLMISLGGYSISRISKKKKIIENKYKVLHNDKIKLESEFDKVLNNLGYKIETSTNRMIKARDEIIAEPIEEFTKEVIEEKFQSIKKTDTVLTDTTSQIIDFLKAKSGKLELKKVKFDINKLLGAITTRASQKYKSKNIELIYDIDKDVPRYILGDYDRLSKIIINMVDNAIKNTQKGKVRLVITTFKEESSNKIEFKVIDTGIGIKEDKMDSIFTPFQNGSSVLNGSGNGSIGLSMSRELVSIMGGILSVRSKYDKGSTFSIKIPLITDESSKDEKSYHLACDKLSKEELCSKNIGIIDSDSESAWAIKNAFAHFIDSITIIPEYGIKDHDILHKCDIIYIDYKLVDALMLELFKQIQANKDFRVVVTSNILEEYDEDINNSTISRHIMKPFSPARILKIFSDEYNSVRVVSNLEELLLMEEEEDTIEDEDIYGLKKYNEPMPETKGVDQDSLREFFGSTILIVEDDRLNRKILERMLESTGIKYAVASSSDETLEQLKKYYNNFDLILMNIAISNMTGYTLAKMIRYDKSFDNIPILAMVDKKDKAVDLAEAGINGYLIKPIKMGTLYTLCDRFLEKVDIENNNILSRLSKSEHILDITRGIMLADNNQQNYIMLLEEFVNAYGSSGEDFESLVINREYEKAKLLAIDMKGLTSIIAANNMNMLISEIEKINVSKEYKKLDKYIERYSEELDDLVTNIEIYIRSINS